MAGTWREHPPESGSTAAPCGVCGCAVRPGAAYCYRCGGAVSNTAPPAPPARGRRFFVAVAAALIVIIVLLFATVFMWQSESTSAMPMLRNAQRLPDRRDFRSEDSTDPHHEQQPRRSE